MGSGYKQYINSGAGGRGGMPTKPRANVSSSSKRILDISEWQGALTDAQVKALKKTMTSSLFADNMALNMSINV